MPRLHLLPFTLLCASLFGSGITLRAMTITAGSVGSIDAQGNVAFSLTFDRAPDFMTVDAVGRAADSFQFYIGTSTVPPSPATRPYLALVRGDEIHLRGDIPVRNDGPPAADPGSGGWGTVRGRVPYALGGRTLTFSVPASVLNVSGRFIYRLDVGSYGEMTGSYTGGSGEPLLFVPPESMAGKVYLDRASVQVFPPRGVAFTRVTQSTIIFEDEERFVYLLDQSSGESADLKTRVLPPKPDGRYRYSRTTNGTGVIALEFDDGTKSSLELSFRNPSEGLTMPSFPERPFSLSSLDAWKAAAARNVSMRGTVAPGRPLIVGFIAPGPREVLIRAVGPSLGAFGVTDGWVDPDFQLYRGNAAYDATERHRGDWDVPSVGSIPASSAAGLRKVFSYLGAFPLQDGSRDAADVVRLASGAYTVICAPVDTGGEVLIEVYFLP